MPMLRRSSLARRCRSSRTRWRSGADWRGEVLAGLGRLPGHDPGAEAVAKSGATMGLSLFAGRATRAVAGDTTVVHARHVDRRRGDAGAAEIFAGISHAPVRPAGAITPGVAAFLFLHGVPVAAAAGGGWSADHVRAGA